MVILACIVLSDVNDDAIGGVESYGDEMAESDQEEEEEEASFARQAAPREMNLRNCCLGFGHRAFNKQLFLKP